MKKTIIALFALAGAASAVTITPITDTTSGSWTFNGRDLSKESVWSDEEGKMVEQDCSTYKSIYMEDGVIKTYHTNWATDSATYTLNSSLNCSTNQQLTFSFEAVNNGSGNGIITLALIGSANAIVVGHGNYDKNYEWDSEGNVITNEGTTTPTEFEGHGDDVQVGVTSDVLSTGGYGFKYTNAKDDVTLDVTSTNNWQNAMPTNGVATTLSGTIAWDGDSFALTLKSSAISDEAFEYDLGITSLDVSKIMVTLEGGGAIKGATPSSGWEMGTVSNIKIGVIPEPTTATLSLLALAGLAARRRRR